MSQDTPNALAEAIREELIRRRKQLGWTIQRLATEMGVTWNHVRDLESGYTRSPSMETISRWADGLGMEISVTFRPRNWSHRTVQKKAQDAA